MFALFSCQMEKANTAITFDLQGHRGCRGILPENSIIAFQTAFELGVNTLELDVVITKDKKVLVSHEPFFSSEISTLPDGKFITADKEKDYNIYEMSYLQTQTIDCGLKNHPRFLGQKKIETKKPLLEDVLQKIEKLNQQENREVYFNIETKSLPETDGIFHPAPEEFVSLLYQVLKKNNVLNKVIIQSFDVRTLQVFKKKYPDVKLALLIENDLSIATNLQSLGFLPDIYSPEYLLVTKELIDFCHNKNIKIIPWTINNTQDFKKIKSLGVDGIITDYPNLFINL
jgi:glycerophosphoryl diester phosphodiesterase